MKRIRSCDVTEVGKPRPVPNNFAHLNPHRGQRAQKLIVNAKSSLPEQRGYKHTLHSNTMLSDTNNY